jgi:hypothetical protein
MAAQHNFPTLGDALNGGFRYLEVRCAGCDLHSAVDLTIVRRPKITPIYELERHLARKNCSNVRGYRYKRGRLVALRQTPILASDPPSVGGPASVEFSSRRSFLSAHLGARSLRCRALYSPRRGKTYNE